MTSFQERIASPAPWRVTCGEVFEEPVPYQVRDKDGRLVASCSWHTSTDAYFPLRPAMEANACLIAAAPDLLDAAKQMLAARNGQQTMSAVISLRNAIVKAEGRS